MAKSDPATKSTGKTRGTRTSPPSATRNERAQGGRRSGGVGGSASGNPKLSKQETGTGRKGGPLH